MFLKLFIGVCILVAMEVFVMGLVNILNFKVPWAERKTGLMASYIWMVPLYIVLYILFGLFNLIYYYNHINDVIIILMNYIFGVIVTTSLETGLGAILIKTIGTCPWGIFTADQRGIFLGYSRWDWSLMYGAATVLFYYFMNAIGWF